MIEPESPWVRPGSHVKAETRYPVIGKEALETAIIEAISDGAEMRDVKILMVGQAQAGKIVAGPEGAPTMPMPVLLVCWVNRSVRQSSNG